METQLIIGSDHAGFEMKEYVKRELDRMDIAYTDVGADLYKQEDDYPTYASRVAEQVHSRKFKWGITICGSGIGASIVANRYTGVRAALCVNPYMARLAREHNDANVLVLGGRIISQQDALEILRTWLSTSFTGEHRHARRIDMIDEITCRVSAPDNGK
jgi:ribose 5-phosphate isomerase B